MMKKERMRWGLERVNEMRGVVGKKGIRKNKTMLKMTMMVMIMMK